MAGLNSKRKLLLSFGTASLLVIGILVSFNVISNFFYLRLDLSGGKIYSISPATKKIVRSLKDPVLIEVYHSKKLPPQIMVMKNYFTDVLKEYQQTSKGMVKVSLIEVNPTKNDKQKTIAKGIMPVRFDVYSKEKFEAIEGFFGAVFKYQDKVKIIPYINGVDNLEYTLTSKIRSITATVKPKVGFISNFNCINFNHLPPKIQQEMQEKFEITPVDLTTTKKIAGDIETLMLLGPQSKISTDSLFTLDQYLLSGGNLLIAYDAKQVNPNVFSVTNNETGLKKFLSHHGIEITTEIILDVQSQQIQISQRKGTYIFTNVVKYPPFITVTDLNKSNQITKDIPSLVFPFASPLKLTKKTEASSVVLAKSSKQSWLTNQKDKKTITLNPFETITSSPNSVKGPFNLAMHLEDNFKPFFTAPPSKDIKDFLKQSVEKAGLTVIGTSKFISPQYRMPGSNYLLFANIIDSLSQDDSLISIRSKSARFAPLMEVSLFKRKLIKYLNILLPPALAIVIGLLMWQFRIRRRKKYGKILSGKNEK